jgi:hypothetical protein
MRHFEPAVSHLESRVKLTPSGDSGGQIGTSRTDAGMAGDLNMRAMIGGRQSARGQDSAALALVVAFLSVRLLV